MTPQFLIILTLSLVVVGGFTALALWVNAKREARLQQMSVIAGGAAALARTNKNKEALKRRDEISRKLKEASEAKSKKDGVTTKQLWRQAGFENSVKSFWVGSLIFGSLVSLLVFSSGFPILAKFFLAFVGFFGLPRFLLKWKIARRQKKFLEEFADALEAMIRLLQAGMPVSEAIAMVSREYEGPVGVEMRQMYNDQKIGIPMGEAAERCAKRMPITEVKMFATALQIQSETGSSLSEVLSNLAAVIRSRFRLKRKVQALSSEAKASAMIIGALPLVVAGGLYAVNPEYIALLFTTGTGKLLSTGAGFWMFCGVMVMRQMINFKV